MRRVSESAFNFTMGDFKIRAETATLSIEDGRKHVKDGGVPNGYVDAEVSASGDIELDAGNLAILAEEAKNKGSWQAIEPVDLLFYCKGTRDEQKVEAFGCLLNLSDIINFDPSSDKKATVKIKYEVTSPDFVRIDGIPYLEEHRTRELV